MTQEKFEMMATERVKQIVNCISREEYDRLLSVTQIDNSWCGEGGTQADGINAFTEWLKEQFALWTEEDGKDYVVDLFDKKWLQLDKLESNYAFATYSATSHGEMLDFWFEFELTVDENEQLTAVLNVNI